MVALLVFIIVTIAMAKHKAKKEVNTQEIKFEARVPLVIKTNGVSNKSMSLTKNVWPKKKK